MKKGLPIAVAMVAILGYAGAASAQQTDTATLNVSATVVDSARIISVTAIDFGSYDPTVTTPTDANGAVEVRATKDLAYKIYITGTREMTDSGGTQTLNYELYSDSSRSSIWGSDSTGAESYTSSSNTAVEYTIYGRVPAEQDVSADSFSDQVTVTLEY